MKTAISVPDEVFAKGEKYAKRAKVSRSELYSKALVEFLSRHAPDEVTAKWDEVIGELGQPDGQFSVKAARQAVERTEW